MLAPAGNFSKLKTAFYFGADAVYLGGKNFSLRAFSDNFDAEDLKKAVDYAHSLGKKAYVTANIFARNDDFAFLSDYFSYLAEIGADAAIVSDIGAMSVLKKAAPSLALHVSTQANTTNKYAVKFYAEELGAERVILARELSLKEIAEIREFNPDTKRSFTARCAFLTAEDVFYPIIWTDVRPTAVRACRRVAGNTKSAR